MDTSQIQMIEELAANAWSAETILHIDGWRLRYSGGPSRRVNSVWANIAHGPLTLQERLEMVEAFYKKRGVPPRYQMCPASSPPELKNTLLSRGYIGKAHTQTQISTIASLLQHVPPTQHQVTLTAQLIEPWFNTYTATSYPDARPITRGILSRIGPPAGFVLINVDGKPAAAGLGVVERGWMGVFCLVTLPEFRRAGLAFQVMHALGKWGQSQGAENIYLQVMENNPPALSFYEKLGFIKQYVYWYAEKSLE